MFCLLQLLLWKPKKTGPWPPKLCLSILYIHKTNATIAGPKLTIWNELCRFPLSKETDSSELIFFEGNTHAILLTLESIHPRQFYAYICTLRELIESYNRSWFGVWPGHNRIRTIVLGLYKILHFKLRLQNVLKWMSHFANITRR